MLCELNQHCLSGEFWASGLFKMENSLCELYKKLIHLFFLLCLWTQSQIFQLYGGIVGLFIFPKTLYSDYLIRNNIFFLQRYWVIPLVYIRVDKSFEFLNEFTFSFHLFDSSLKGFYFGYFISLPLGKPDFKLSPRYHWQHSTPSVMYKYIQLFSIFQLS